MTYRRMGRAPRKVLRLLRRAHAERLTAERERVRNERRQQRAERAPS